MMNRKEFEAYFINNKSLMDVTKDDVLRLLGEDVAVMIGYDQNNPHHCYDLWDHSVRVMLGLKSDSNNLLKVAALFHDIGKPYVAKEKDGRTVFYGHAPKSVEISRLLLFRLGYTADEIDEIVFYIGHHDDFISWVLPQEDYNHQNKYLIEISAPNLETHIIKNSLGNSFSPKKENWKRLLALCKADAKAQADEVWQKGKLIDTKIHKLSKVRALCDALEASQVE